MGPVCAPVGAGGILIPFGNILGPLIIWQIKKAEMPFVDDQGKEALNLNHRGHRMIVSMILMLVLIGVVLMFLVGIAALAFAIIAAIKANEGQYYRYPFTLRLVK